MQENPKKLFREWEDFSRGMFTYIKICSPQYKGKFLGIIIGFDTKIHTEVQDYLELLKTLWEEWKVKKRKIYVLI